MLKKELTIVFLKRFIQEKRLTLYLKKYAIIIIILFSITNLGELINDRVIRGSFGIGGPPYYRTKTYRVKPRENLWIIAQKRKLKLDTLLSVNKLRNANRLFGGQEILIPNQNGILYKVKRREDIWSIAKKFDISIEDILDVNDFSINEAIAGKELFVPGAELSSTERLDYLGFRIIKPAGGRITCGYGWRRHPLTGRRRFHTGIDFGALMGSPIKAAQAGKVVFAGFKGYYGKTVILRHSKGYTTIYGHCSKLLVKEGDYVKAGRIIAKVGNSGRSTGPHLHFEIRRWGTPKNPLRMAHFLANR